MPPSIKTILEVDDKKLRESLDGIKKYYKSTYNDWAKSTEEVTAKSKELAKQKELLASSMKNLETAKKSSNSSDKETVNTLKDEIAERKSNIKVLQAEQNALKAKASAQSTELSAITQSVALSKQSTEQKEKHTKATDSSTNSLVRHLRQLETMALVLYTAKTAWDKTLGAGIETNKMMEDNMSGIAALVSANTQMVLSNGKVVNSYEKFQLGQALAKQTLVDLKAATVGTFATFPQLTQLFQQAIGHTLGMGDSFGKTTKDIISNTIKFVQSMSIVGGSVGMEMQKVQEETRSMLSGNASTDSLLAIMLFGSPTQANEAIRDAKKRGAEGVSDLMTDMMRAFEPMKDVDSYSKNLIALQKVWSDTMQELSDPVFEDLKDVFKILTKDITDNKEAIIEWGTKTYEALKTASGYIGDVALGYLAWKSIPAIIGAAELAMLAYSMATKKATVSSEAATIATRTLGTALKGVALASAPLIALTAVYEIYNSTLDNNAEKENELSKITSRKVSDIEKLGKAQAKLEQDQLARKIASQKAELASMNSEPEMSLGYESEYLVAISKKAKFTLEEAAAKENLSKSLEENIKLAQEYDNIISGKKTEAQTGDMVTKIKEDIAYMAERNKETIKAKGEIFEQEEKIKKDLELQVKLKQIQLGLEKEIAGFKDKPDTAVNKTQLEVTQKQLKANIEQQAQNERNTAASRQKIAEETQKIQEKEFEQTRNSSKLALDAAYKLAIANNDEVAIADKKRAILVDELKTSKEMWDFAIKSNANQDQQNKAQIKFAEAKIALSKEDAAIAEKQMQDREKEFKAKVKMFELDVKSVERNMDTDGSGFISSTEYTTAIDQITEKYNKLAEEFNKINGEMTEADKLAKARLTENLEKAKDDLTKIFEKKTFEIDIKLNGFDDTSKSIAGIVNGLSSVVNENSKIATQQAKVSVLDKNSIQYAEEKNKLDKMTIENSYKQIGTYANMSDAMGSFYDEDDQRKKKQADVSKALHMAEMAMQLTTMLQSTAFTSLFVTQEAIKSEAAGVTAVAVAAQSSPWTGFITAAAMAAMLASFGIMLGGKEKVTTSSDAFSAQAENIGTGSVLGDTSKTSESIKNSLSILEEFAKPEYRLSQQMAESLASIDQKIGGVTSLLIRQGGFAFGEGYTGAYDTGYSNNVSVGSGLQTAGGLALAAANTGVGITTLNMLGLSSGVATMGAATLAATGVGLAVAAIDKFLLGGAISNLIGGAINGLLGGLFGKTSTSQSLTDYGINFNDALLSEAIKEINGQSYQEITTTVKKKSWFSSSTSTSVSTYFESLNDEINNQFSMVLENLYGTTILAGQALDVSSSAIESSLASFTISIGKISTEGKTGDELQEQLSNIFSEIADGIAVTAFPMITAYQKAGEGLFETMTRVANDITIVTETLKLFGKNITENKLVVSESLLDISGSIGDFANLTSSYYDSYFTEAERYANTLNMLNENFESLNLVAPKTYEGFRRLVDSLDVTTEAGRETFISVMQLADSFTEIGEVARQSQSNIKEWQDSFKTQEQLMQDMANSFSVPLATTYTELDILFKTLSQGIDGLTDSELTFMKANKEALDATEKANKEALKTSLSTMLSDTTKNISSLESAVSSLSGIIDKLKGDALGSEYSLEKYYNSMRKTLSLSGSSDIASFQASLQDTISASSVLFDAENFTATRDQKFAQLVAANQFSSMETTALTQIDYLKMIEENTRVQIDAINGIQKTFITEKYKEILGRTPDQAGADYWNSQLASGNVQTSTFGQTLIAGAEASGEMSRVNAITALYSGGLGRQPDQAGLDYWVNSGLSIAEISGAMLQAAPTNNEKFTPFAEGGLVKGGRGGIMGMIGEKSYDEIIIPLKNSNDPFNSNAIIKELRELRKEVEELRKQNGYYQDRIDKNTQPSRYTA